ncbi:hypothetical protein Tco_0205621 [Tanacetum coccineum]
MQLIKPMIVDAYDSDCDALNSANIALIANLSRNWLQMHSLSTQSGKPGPMNLINHINLQNSIRFEKPFYLKKVRESKPKLYDGNVILKMDTIVIPDSDETLMLCKESRSKMLLKEQDPMVKNSVLDQNAPSFTQLFELSELRAQSQAKDTVIVKLKEQIKSLKGNVDDSKVKMDMDEIETLNIELEHRVTKLVAENEHLKQTYKQLYDSIKPKRVQSKEQW